MTFIAEGGEDRSRHVFGGDAWKLVVPLSSSPPPAIILTLDASDERLGLNWHSGHLPLASRLDGGIPQRQSYVVQQDVRTVTFEGPAWRATGDETSDLPSPLPQRPLRLRPLRAREDLATGLSKYDVQDTFLGGEAFLRIGGEPLWLFDPEKVECTCGRELIFIACVGYEHYSNPSGLIAPGVPFFLGELALYFFCCSSCSRVVAVTQPT